MRDGAAARRRDADHLLRRDGERERRPLPAGEERGAGDGGPLKNDFIQNVSYELRDPLQSVTMAAAMLADEAVGPLNAKQKDYAESAKRSADALLSLMNDIFDLASLDAGTIELELESVEPTKPSNRWRRR